MRRLSKLDHRQQIVFVDLHQDGFSEQYPEVDPVAASIMLHGQLADGRWLYGLDVTVAAWQLVGRGRWLQLLRSRALRGLSDIGYRFFARHRYTFSALLTGKRQCQIGTKSGRRC